MKDIFEQLESEHKIILCFLNAFDKKILSAQKSIKDLEQKTLPSFLPANIEFFNSSIRFIEIFMDKLHHGKEEQLLFPLAERTGVPRQGGAQCTKYFGLFMERRFLDEVQEIIKNPEIKITEEHKFPDEIIQIIDANSALKIPLEDHTSGFYLKILMKMELSQIFENKDRSTHDFFKYCCIFSDMLRIHIEKEDNCLFPVLKERISQKEIDTISKMSIVYEKSLEAELQGISKFVSVFSK